MKLAIVDDNKLEQELIFNTLRTYEHERNISLDISSYSDGNSFLNTYVPGDFDLIFMDIYLNELNGIDIVRKIRQMDSKVMIVFLSTVIPIENCFFYFACVNIFHINVTLSSARYSLSPSS